MDRNIVSGVFTVDDVRLYEFMRMLNDTEDIRIEPSSCAAFLEPLQVARTPAGHNSPNVHGITSEKLQNAAHICWATGGALVPEDVWEEWFKEYNFKSEESSASFRIFSSNPDSENNA